MKTQVLFLLLFSFSIIGSTFGQKGSTSNTFAIKNYFSIGYEKDDLNFFFANEDYTLTDSNQVVDYRLIRPAFNIFTKDGFLHEFEISEFQFSKDNKFILYEYFNPDSVSTTEEYDFVEVIRRFSFKYSMNIPLLKRSNYTVYLGGGIQPFYERVWSHSLPEEQFPYTEANLKTIGINFQLTPRLIFPISEKMFVDVNALLPILKIENTKYSQKIDGEDKVYEKDINQMLKGVTELAIGIGYKF